jgi:adenylate cyclase
MNPNMCTLCETKFKLVMKVKQVRVPATILFADIRGYTDLSQRLDAPDVPDLLGEFYEACGEAIWGRDGIINKLIGDAVLAIFNFPLEREDHVEQAVLSAVDLQAKCSALGSQLRSRGAGDAAVGVGVGLHTGAVSIGEIGQYCKDFTAVGEVVNLSSRLQGAARPGEVLVTEEVYRQVEASFPGAEARVCDLKGVDKPVTAYALTAERAV